MRSGQHQQARFYGIVDTAYVSHEQCAAKCSALIAGGAGIVQLRAKAESSAERAALLEQLLPCVEGAGVSLILNDDLELACRYPRVGLHVGQDDTPVERCRELLGPERLLGLSTHSPQQAANALACAALLDYFAVGPVFAPQTKPPYTPVGCELVRFVAQLRPSLRWYAFGGVNRNTAAQVYAAGAPGVVAVSDVLLATDTAGAVRAVIAQANTTTSSGAAQQ